MNIFTEMFNLLSQYESVSIALAIVAGVIGVRVAFIQDPIEQERK